MSFNIYTIIYKVFGFKCVEKITHYKGVKEAI